jgi:hypothetical protein
VRRVEEVIWLVGRFITTNWLPHISPAFGEMWVLAALESEILRHNRQSRASIR